MTSARRVLPGGAPIAVAVTVVAVALVALPLGYLVARATDARGGLGALVSAELIALAARTLGLALVVGALATVLAILLAVLTHAVDLPARRLAAVAVVLPLAIPSYVAASAYVAGVSPRGPLGPVIDLVGLGPVYPSGWGWAVLILVASTVPLAYLPARAALARADGDLYDAARTLGRGRSAALAVALRPTLGRAALSGFVVVTLYTLAEFGTVALLRVEALPRVIYQQYLSAFDRAGAARSALLLVALVGLVVSTAGLLERSPRSIGRGRPLVVRLGRARWLALTPIALFVLLAAIVPISSLVAWAARAADPTRGLLDAAVGSLRAAALVVGPATVLALAVAVAAERTRTGRVLARVVDVGFALPGLVVALGLSVAALRVWPAAYQTWVPYVAAMTILFTPLATAAIHSALATIPASLGEAARTLGATPTRAFLRVTLPLLRPGVLAGAALVLIATAKELGASLLLLPIGEATLATRLWDATEEARYAEAAAPALALIALAGVAAFALEGRRVRGGLT